MIFFLYPILVYLGIVICQLFLRLTFGKKVRLLDLIYYAIFLLMFYYPEISRKVFETFSCRTIAKEMRLSMYILEKCYS
jgi:hypothetical protein